MRFLVDNAIAASVAEGLRAAGHDAVHVRDREMGAAPDDAIMRVAESEDRVVVSADTDFGYLLAIAGATKPSFLLFRSSDRRPAAVLAMILGQLDALVDDLEAGCVAVFEDERIRVRRLPL